jgi:hypothetical protein
MWIGSTSGFAKKKTPIPPRPINRTLARIARAARIKRHSAAFYPLTDRLSIGRHQKNLTSMGKRCVSTLAQNLSNAGRSSDPKHQR